MFHFQFFTDKIDYLKTIITKKDLNKSDEDYLLVINDLKILCENLKDDYEDEIEKLEDKIEDLEWENRQLERQLEQVEEQIEEFTPTKTNYTDSDLKQILDDCWENKLCLNSVDIDVLVKISKKGLYE